MLNFGFKRRRRWGLLFRDKNNQPLSTTITSNKIKLPTGGVLTFTGLNFSIDGSEFGTTGTADDGAIIIVQIVSSTEYEAETGGVLSVDGVEYDTFTVTTITNTEHAADWSMNEDWDNDADW